MNLRQKIVLGLGAAATLIMLLITPLETTRGFDWVIDVGASIIVYVRNLAIIWIPLGITYFLVKDEKQPLE